MVQHEPVLVKEVIKWLDLKTGGYYLDGTIGLAGHSLALLQEANINILGLDKDVDSLKVAKDRLGKAGYLNQVKLRNLSFRYFASVLDELGWQGLDGVLLDLGMSSCQLDNPERGFSFLHNGPLDMRMDQESQLTAKDIVNSYPKEELKKIIRELGQEPLAGRIVARIIEKGQKHPITRTTELADIVRLAYPRKMRYKARNHPATRTFQALRIAVNSELEDLRIFLQEIPDYMKNGARIVIISFHSLEDRIVKQRFQNKNVFLDSGLIKNTIHRKKIKALTKKPLLPTKEERDRNPRSRSAKLRVAEVLKE